MEERVKAFSKRFGALATDFAYKYRFEPFFRTEINVLGLQVGFGLLILILVGLSLSFLYQDVMTVLSRGIIETAVTKAPPGAVGASVTSQLEVLQTRNIGILIGSVITATIVFAYFIAYVTLAPVRNALESQKQFISNVAHELRTPLSTIKTNTEVALFDPALQPDLRDMMKSNIEELDRVSDIINNLLSVSASVRPERIKFENVDLGAVADIAVKKLEPLAQRKGIEVTTRKGSWRTVWGNASALEQIITNILKNALTYTPEHGRVGIVVESMGPGLIELTIQDSGPGIARRDLFHIFEPFYRADRSRNRAHGGSGLGLTIVNELVKVHAGRITIRSAEGRGTTVVVLFPAGMDDSSGTRDKGADEVAFDFTHHGKNGKNGKT